VYYLLVCPIITLDLDFLLADFGVPSLRLSPGLCDNGVVADCELFFDETGVFNTFGGKPLPGVTGSTTLLSSESLDLR
jgi:hypothetical protein